MVVIEADHCALLGHWYKTCIFEAGMNLRQLKQEIEDILEYANQWICTGVQDPARYAIWGKHVTCIPSLEGYSCVRVSRTVLNLGVLPLESRML